MYFPIFEDREESIFAPDVICNRLRKIEGISPRGSYRLAPREHSNGQQRKLELYELDGAAIIYRSICTERIVSNRPVRTNNLGIIADSIEKAEAIKIKIGISP